MPGAQLWVSSRLEMLGAGPVTLGWVRTNAHGRFVYTPPAGASRAVSFTFADSAAVRTASVAIRVVPRIALRFSRAGVIAGRVAGAPPVPRPIVELQSRVGPMWHTFSTTRLSPLDGTFAARPRRPPAPGPGLDPGCSLVAVSDRHLRGGEARAVSARALECRP